MRTAELIEQTEFHDASVLAMTLEGDRVRLKFGDVWTAPDKRYEVDVIMGGIRKLTCENVPISNLRMDQEDGSVVAFRHSAKTAELVVTWTTYKPRADTTKSYKFEFTTFDLHVQGLRGQQNSHP